MRFSEAAKVFVRVLEIDASAEAARQKLVSLQRDVFTDIEAAKQTFEPLRHVQEHHAEDSFRLHEAVFAAYDANWGLCRDALSKALEVIGARFPAETVDDWVRASAVLLHLNYGVEMLSFLRECGADVRLRPWVEASRRSTAAIAAFCKTSPSRRGPRPSITLIRSING